ncbi:hypothetical protein [Photobacterium swingsii]|uniref:hypothetical protein n=1 Tax=Photobacterium swingsii TaxID=680026 RepID=UPI001187565B|nr:hypothetical protein [Photobacterium swingsii]
MKMTSADVTSLQEFGHNGKRLLRACKEPGQAVVNDGAGDDERNVAGRVAFLDNDSRSALIQQLAQKWQQHKAVDCFIKPFYWMVQANQNYTITRNWRSYSTMALAQVNKLGHNLPIHRHTLAG